MENVKQSLLFVFGTRPEVIKLAPVIRAFEEDGAFDVKVCVTAQHREMMDQFLSFFGLQPDVDLDLMTHDQSLAEIASRVIASCSEIYAKYRPDMVFVQGDTMTAFAAAFAARIGRIPVAHVEAGLRSHDRESPFPEEISRTLISHLAELHFAHTESASANLEREGITENVFVVGNTVVDALLLALDKLARSGDASATFAGIDLSHPLVLVTLHRRESLGAPLTQACTAIKEIAALHPGAEFIYPVHLNPRVRESVSEVLSGIPNVHLLDPLDYPDFIRVLSKASLIITDSGGVVEEATTLGIPTLVVRRATERAEAVSAGHAQLVGFDIPTIVAAAREALAAAPRQGPNTPRHVFGDGLAAKRIVDVTKRHFLENREAKEEPAELVLSE